jgi:uncharacterized LabA/DUF88 family protein
MGGLRHLCIGRDMSRVAIFIDGGYVDKVLRHEFGGAKIAYARFSQEISAQIHPDIDILRTYYYHCLPYKSDPPTPEESQRFASMQNFLDAINRLPRFEVRLGRLARRGPDKDGRYYFEQKMIDVLLSIDLVHLSSKGQIGYVAIVGGDSDFVPAIKMAKSEGVSVWLFHGERPRNDLLDIADERIRITQALVNRVLWQPRFTC